MIDVSFLVNSRVASHFLSPLLRCHACSAAMSEQAQDDLTFWQYLFGSLGLGVLCVVNGEMSAGFHWLRNMTPDDALSLLGFYGLQYVGVQAILEIVQLFDATMAQVVSSVRRICTFILSFFVFPKPFGAAHALGTTLVIGGAYLLERSRSAGHNKMGPVRGGERSHAS